MKLGGLHGLLKYDSYCICMDLGMFGLWAIEVFFSSKSLDKG